MDLKPELSLISLTDEAMSVPQNRFQEILYQAQQIGISHIETPAFQALQQK